MPTPANSKPGSQEAENDYRDDIDQTLHRAKTAGAVSISAELFEKLYLAPKTEVNGQLRRTFGNPTPMYNSLGKLPALALCLPPTKANHDVFSISGLVGFLLALTPLSCDLMQWRGAGSTGATGM